MQGLEKSLDDMFKKLPQLPENGKKGLANALPWLALVGGILSLLAVWYLYQAVAWVDQWANFANGLTTSFGYAPTATGISMLAWVSLALLALQAVLMFIAFPGLRAHKKSGWNVLLWSAFINIVYDVVYNLFGYGYMNIGSLIFSLIGAFIGLYLLFEVRAYFTGAASAAAPKAPTATPPATDKKA